MNATIFPKSPLASVRPHHPSDSNRRDGKPMAAIGGKKIARYKNRIFTGRFTRTMHSGAFI